MKRVLIIILFLLIISLSFISTPLAQAPLVLPRSETLYINTSQPGPPSAFNPFNPLPSWPCGSGQQPFIYETLFAYNLLTGKLEPLLAESYKWSGYSVTINLHKIAKWHDGIPVTAKDVVYTFQLGKKYSLYFSAIWDYITDVKAKDDYTVVITLNKDKPHKKMVETYLGQILIVPQHVWNKLDGSRKELQEFTNTNPIGSGPYKLLDYSPERIIIERYENYWGIPIFGKPVPKYIVHIIPKSNDVANLLLEKGELDLSQAFCPNIWEMWEKKKLPVGTWYKKEPYHMVATIVALYINVNRKPLNNPLVRRALAYAIDYNKIVELAASRYSPVVKSSLLIPEGLPESKYFSQEDVDKFGWKYDPKKAVEILEKELKAKKGPDGIYVLPDGTRLGPFVAECPYGWSDWMTTLEIISESAKAVGIEIRPQYPDIPTWADHRNTGNFDFILMIPAMGYTLAHPWLRFRDVMEIKGVPPIGQVAYWNYGRYSNQKASLILNTIVKTTDEERLKILYRELDRIFMKDIPVIPLNYRAWHFFEYNESYWVGFPNADNPYAPPIHTGAGIKIFYNIKPKK